MNDANGVRYYKAYLNIKSRITISNSFDNASEVVLAKTLWQRMLLLDQLLKRALIQKLKKEALELPIVQMRQN